MTEPRYPLLGLSRHRMELDGEGVTTRVAGAGCLLSCAYCINKSVLCQAPTLVSAAELYEKTKIDDLYFQATGGGLCFGGGESLLHLDFYEALRRTQRESGAGPAGDRQRPGPALRGELPVGEVKGSP